jgi:WD40 repeat protein
MSLQSGMLMAPYAYGMHHPVQCWQPSMDTKNLSPPWCSTNEEHGLHLVLKIPTSLYGMWLEKPAYTGKSVAGYISVCIFLTTLRLRGHRDQITNIRFFSSPNDLPSTSTSTAPGYLLTSAKDTFVKFWDLSTQHCVQTIVAHRSEVWSLDINKEQDLLFTGSGEGEVKAWRIDSEALSTGLRETENGEVCCSHHTSSMDS